MAPRPRPHRRARRRVRAAARAALLSVTGAVVAGGAAERYGGEAKGLLEVCGRRIIDRVVDALREATGADPILVANVEQADRWVPGLRRVPDVVAGAGSLGGILTAVEAAGDVVCVAWDMPFVPAALLRELADGLASSDVVIPESDSHRGVEPLCAAYGAACGPAIRAALARSDQRAIAFHGDVRVHRVPRERVLQYGDPGVLFFNVNTPRDLAHAESLCRPG